MLLADSQVLLARAAVPVLQPQPQQAVLRRHPELALMLPFRAERLLYDLGLQRHRRLAPDERDDREGVAQPVPVGGAQVLARVQHQSQRALLQPPSRQAGRWQALCGGACRSSNPASNRMFKRFYVSPNEPSST